MKRSIVFLLLLSVLFAVFDGQGAVVAVPVTSTTTLTTTTYLSLTGTGETTFYQTLSEVTSFQTVTGTTYITTKVVAVPVQVQTTVVQGVIKTAYGEGVGCTPGGSCVTTYVTEIYTSYVTQTGVAVVYSPSTVQSAVTSQYTTNVPTTVFSTSTSTSTMTTGQVVSITNTETISSVTDVQPPPLSISDIVSQNLMLILVILVGLVLGILGFTFGRRGSRGVSGPSRVSASGFCVSCGSAIPHDAQFCPKCGQKRIDK